MKNLEQIRAKHALDCSKMNLDFAGEEGGDVVRKIPALIINHGLLQTLAFAETKDGYRNICDQLAKHLADLQITPNCNSTRSLIEHLVAQDSTTLKYATQESLAWFNYARRFIK